MNNDRCCEKCWKSKPHPKDCKTCEGEGFSPAECNNKDCPCHTPPQEDLAGQINEGLERHFAEEEPVPVPPETLKILSNLQRIVDEMPDDSPQEEPWVAGFDAMISSRLGGYGDQILYREKDIKAFIQKTLEADRKERAGVVVELVKKILVDEINLANTTTSGKTSRLTSAYNRVCRLGETLKDVMK